MDGSTEEGAGGYHGPYRSLFPGINPLPVSPSPVAVTSPFDKADVEQIAQRLSQDAYHTVLLMLSTKQQMTGALSLLRMKHEAAMKATAAAVVKAKDTTTQRASSRGKDPSDEIDAAVVAIRMLIADPDGRVFNEVLERCLMDLNAPPAAFDPLPKSFIDALADKAAEKADRVGANARELAGDLQRYARDKATAAASATADGFRYAVSPEGRRGIADGIRSAAMNGKEAFREAAAAVAELGNDAAEKARARLKSVRNKLNSTPAERDDHV